MAKILVVEDEQVINDLIVKHLTLVGHVCLSAYEGVEALSLIREYQPDLIILDVMLPGLDGFDLAKLITNVPIIFVTAKNNLSDKLKGLSLGAEDYIVKPFEMQELLARVRVVLRRTKRDANEFNLDGLLIDFGARKVYRGGEEIVLTPKEFALLETLVQNRNIALTDRKSVV